MSIVETIDNMGKMGGNKLRETLLEKIDFAIDHYGQPNEYYNCDNPDLGEINDGLKEVILMHKVMFDDENEIMVQSLYGACVGAKSKECLKVKDFIKTERYEEYKKFYVNLKDYMTMWLYGSKRTNVDGFSVLFHKLFEARFMLKNGAPRKETRYHEYKKDLVGNGKLEAEVDNLGYN
jgi:hypothetical protein